MTALGTAGIVNIRVSNSGDQRLQRAMQRGNQIMVSCQVQVALARLFPLSSFQRCIAFVRSDAFKSGASLTVI